MAETTRQHGDGGRRRGWVGFALAMAIGGLMAFAIAALALNIFERKREATEPFVRVVKVDEVTTDPAVWGRNWPREFDTYKRTVDPTRTRYGGSAGSEALPAESRIERDPWLKRMFLGYAFSIDFRDRRGHAYMLHDQEVTKRVTDKPQSGACLHCHASIVPTWRRLGLEADGKTFADADPHDFNWPAVQKGFVKAAAMSYTDAHAELLKTPDGSPTETQLVAGGSSVTEKSPANAQGLPAKAPTTREALAHHVGEAHPVSCVDCHDPKSMELRVTRPGFVNGIRKLAEGDGDASHLPSVQRWRAGDRQKPYDPNVDASRQEMRTFACAQCHVEYYCATKETLFFPWDNGLKVEQIEKTYDDHKFPDGTPFFDFKHTETGAKLYKAQHPEFEMWSQGVHARAGVACADCHMPYTRVGASKVTDHWVRSPLLMINRSCQTCHNVDEKELERRVHTIQDRTHALMGRAGQSADQLLTAVVAAKKAGATEDQLKPIYDLQRKGQWRLDYVNAENSMGFHADQEAARILGESIDYLRQGQVLAERLAPRTAAGPAATQPSASAR
ncbi:MAG TPA: ammonia-forming cytochrome c nitrite reductase subunit c552 [Tepidisphaeraceae bacterium]|nr:ammonia-forming cytochrome c nitrite reductase subunit c552 [Tepidisphaeraceae bacterium]